MTDPAKKWFFDKNQSSAKVEKLLKKHGQTDKENGQCS